MAPGGGSGLGVLLVLIFDNLLAQVPHLYTHIRECICLRLRVLACIHVMTRASHIGVALLVYTHHGLHITRMLTCTFMYTHIHHQQRSAADILTLPFFFELLCVRWLYITSDQ